MRAYYYDNAPGDQRLPHDSGRDVPLETLAALGVLYWRIPVDAPEGWERKIDAIAEERKYSSRDVVTANKDALGAAFEEKMAMFFKEHIHEDEEIRYLLEGSAFFDVREHTTDSWVRCHLEAGDMIILPAGIYHRFSLDEQEHARTLRLFKIWLSAYCQDEPQWIAHYRGPETDNNPHRLEYLKAVSGMPGNSQTAVVAENAHCQWGRRDTPSLDGFLGMTNWGCDLVIGATYLSFMDRITPAGAFGFYEGLCYAFVLCCFPETAGLRLEEVQLNFRNGFGNRDPRERAAARAFE
ncbi:hypothetical protein BN946_scf184983.g32 [Trametes cinnabarina]|uniref:Acireductone dioxygenase n=1 Tax=Pycnoporus cinnabarinus TaxID=5643 RepID=A0A060SJY8_PYCCI|nr:hypothetical protein BN946_scf184983.g32 [Trametes cinnabarina]